jgi:hypothetical protein
LRANGNPRERPDAKGLILQLSSFESIFVMHLFDIIFPVTDSLSEYLQNKAGDTVEICSLVEATKCSLTQMRSNDAYRNIF